MENVYKFCVEGKASGMIIWTIFYWASAITMPELVEINLVSDDDCSLTDKKLNLSYRNCDFSRYEMKL